MRVRYGPIIIPKQLKMGRWMKLDSFDLESLYDEVDLKPQVTETVGRAQREKKLRPLKNTTPKMKRKESSEKGQSKRSPRVRGR
jgi:23S rRNA pseudouridine2605 synthase